MKHALHSVPVVELGATHRASKARPMHARVVVQPVLLDEFIHVQVYMIVLKRSQI